MHPVVGGTSTPRSCKNTQPVKYLLQAGWLALSPLTPSISDLKGTPPSILSPLSRNSAKVQSHLTPHIKLHAFSTTLASHASKSQTRLDPDRLSCKHSTCAQPRKVVFCFFKEEEARKEMGICHSSASACVADTAKLILPDGGLQEFAYPIRVRHVLQSCETACFICNSDDMGFDGIVSAVDGDDELRPGQLYFALPLSRLKRPLEAKEMAALAVKASLAMKAKGRGRKCGRAAVFSGEKEGSCPAEWGGCSGGGGNGGSVKRPGGGGGRGRRRSVEILSAIPE